MKLSLQKSFIILFMGLFLSGCQLEWRKRFDLEFMPHTFMSTLEAEYRSISSDGVYLLDNHTKLTFDKSKNRMTISYINDTSEWYSLETLEDTPLAGMYRLHGTGQYDNRYLGLVMSTNINGSFLKMHIQESSSGVIDNTTSKSYSYASYSLIFRLHKNYLNQTAREINSSGQLVSGGGTFEAMHPNVGEYTFTIDKGNAKLIYTDTTTLYVLGDSSIEVMDYNSGGGYIAIQYDNNSTKMKKLASTSKLSKDEWVSKFSKMSYDYDFVKTPAEEILDTMTGTYVAVQTKLDGDKYIHKADTTDDFSLRVAFDNDNRAIDISTKYGSDIGTADYSEVVDSGFIETTYGEHYKYIKYTLTGEQKITSLVSGYVDRDMLVMVKTDANGNFDSTSEMFVHFLADGGWTYYHNTTTVATVPATPAYIGGSVSVTKENSANIFAYIGGGDEVDLKPYFNFNMPDPELDKTFSYELVDYKYYTDSSLVATDISHDFLYLGGVHYGYDGTAFRFFKIGDSSVKVAEAPTSTEIVGDNNYIINYDEDGDITIDGSHDNVIICEGYTVSGNIRVERGHTIGNIINYGTVTDIVNYGTVTGDIINYGTVTDYIDNYGTVTGDIINYGTVTDIVNGGTVTDIVNFGTVAYIINYGTVTDIVNFGTVTSSIASFDTVTGDIVNFGTVGNINNYSTVTGGIYKTADDIYTYLEGSTERIDEVISYFEFVDIPYTTP